MIKLAIMTDAHGNLPAVKAIMHDIKENECDFVYHLGDSIAIGAYPKETLDYLLKEKVIMLMGNHEEYYLNGIENAPEEMSLGEVNHHFWVKKELKDEYIDIISKFEYEKQLDIEGVKIRLIHYALTQSGKKFYTFKDLNMRLDTHNIDDFFDSNEYDIVVYGHHHPYFDFYSNITKTRYINPGSLGCTRDDYTPYVIIEIENGVYKIKHKKIKYDREEALRALENRHVPEREFIKSLFYGVKSD